MSNSIVEEKYSELTCCLTNELMLEPVITNHGISYEKNAIEAWLQNNNICPVTNNYLDSKMLIKNYTLKNLILRLIKDTSQDIQNQNQNKNKDNIKNIHKLQINDKIFIEVIENKLNHINIINNIKYFNGIAKYYINNILTYKGEIKNNKILGYGKFYKKNKIKYKGYFNMINDNIYINGYGIEYYKNGNIKYIGDFKNSKKHGNGIYYLESNEILYKGQYKNNKRHGHGLLYYYNFINNNPTNIKRIVKSTFKNNLIWNYKN